MVSHPPSEHLDLILVGHAIAPTAHLTNGSILPADFDGESLCDLHIVVFVANEPAQGYDAQVPAFARACIHIHAVTLVPTFLGECPRVRQLNPTNRALRSGRFPESESGTPRRVGHILARDVRRMSPTRKLDYGPKSSPLERERLIPIRGN